MPWFSEGPRNAKIVIVGESPGKQEVERGRPFVGGSGDLLDSLLSEHKISRRECYVTNLCHVRPPEDDFAWFFKKTNPQGQEHLLRGLLKLRADLQEIRPNLVLALGSQPLKALTGKVSVDKWRGSVLPCTLVPGLKVLSTYHPAAILRFYDYKVVTRFDMGKVARESQTPTITYPDRRIVLPDCEWVRSGVGDIEGKWVSTEWNLPEIVATLLRAPSLALDIECYETDHGWALACVGFAPSPGFAVSIPADSPERLQAIRTLVESNVPKILQNGTFDFSVLMDCGFKPQNFWWDTMIAHHILYAECAGGSDEISNMTGTKRQAALKKGLAFLTSVNTNEPFYKDDGKLWKASGDKRVFYRYNGLDCCTTIESQLVQANDLREFGVQNAFRSRMELVRPLIDATRTGILVDLARREQMLNEVTSKERALQLILDTAAGHPVNVSSNKQVTALLYDELHLPVRKKRGKGNKLVASRSGDAATIDALARDFPGVPALQAILRIREQRVLRERYLATPLGKDSRIRCSFDITGTRSYRLSSRASLDGTGTNLQNQPVPIREVYVADPGCVLISSDYSQAEAVVVAYESEDEALQSVFADPTRDVHRENASGIFGLKLDEVTDLHRYLGKKGVHATNYGMMPPKLVEIIESEYETTGIRITLREAEAIIASIHALRPNIKSIYWEGVKRELRDSRTLTNAWGYKRTFFGRWDDNLVRDAYSWKPQSTVGILGCMAWVAVARAVEPLRGKVLLNVHDSLVVQCPREAIENVAERMVEAMKIPITIKGKTFTLRVDTDVGYNWGKRKKDKKTGEVSNPNGLRSLKEFLENPERV